MRAAFALRIISGRIIFISRLSRSAERDKRIFTGGVVTESGICCGDEPSQAHCVRQLPLFVAARHLPPAGGSRPLGWGLWHGGKVSG